MEIELALKYSTENGHYTKIIFHEQSFVLYAGFSIRNVSVIASHHCVLNFVLVRLSKKKKKKKKEEEEEEEERKKEKKRKEKLLLD
jgi:large-conductance mechanosensitive channel